MADDAERMAALKRAYADIILNTAKESAARILASERKVRQLQRSLSLTKEDSLAMLLRLKAIMDSKTVLACISKLKLFLHVATSTGETINDALSDEYVKNDMELEEKMSTKPDHIPAEELDNSVTKENHETINEPHYDYRDELSGHCGPATEVGGDKILKYTFQRKRKRGSLDGKVEPTFIKENMSKRKVDKDDSELEPQESSIVVESSRPEPQKSSLVVESSRDSRRLAQVARQ
ncbi:Potassium transporter, partial [Musa troglodytarum]